MNNEIWKDIVGYEGLYQVSNTGRVKSLARTIISGQGAKRTTNDHILNQTEREGYLRVSLYKDGKGKRFSVHRLVAEAFIPNLDNKQYIDHINTDRKDNRVENLQWVTHIENMNNPITKRKIDKVFKDISKLGAEASKKKVRCKTTGKVFNSIKEAEEYYHLGKQSKISACCKGTRKTCGQYNGVKLEWEYVS